MFAFGTQLNYVYTYGSLITLYVVLIYASVNFTIAALLIAGRVHGAKWLAGFVLSLCVLALSTEWWLNYAAALMVAAGFGVAWSVRHAEGAIRARAAFILLATLAVTAVYLILRLQVPGQFVEPGAEEELLFTYAYPILMVEDAVANFFTLLYVSLSNYLPSFLTSSNSLTYLGPATIIAEQHGYDAAHQQLVVMNHVFLWRFYAGVAVTLFLAALALAAHRAWRTRSFAAALAVALMLMVIAGFATHLAIKMRPYNTVPALPYKVTISVSAMTVLLAWLTMRGARRIRRQRRRIAFVAGVWACVLVAAVTKPAMQAAALKEVGLAGFRDPLGQLLQWLR
jgi:hypothetical protein